MATELEIAQTQLSECRDAISAALKNQSTTILGRTFTKADLKELRGMERDLMTRVQRMTRGSLKVSRVYLLG